MLHQTHSLSPATPSIGGFIAAVGIISAPEFITRRTALRASWLTWPNFNQPESGLLVRFVVRSKALSAGVRAQLSGEQAAFADLLPVQVAWNESRIRGPVLSLAAWIRYATRHYATARFIAKVDDDVYLHLPDVEAMMRSIIRAEGNRTEYAYLGMVSFFHWFPDIFERSGFGWRTDMAIAAGSSCRNRTEASARCNGHECGVCVGPFPFASGYFIVLGRGLAAHIAASRMLAEDEARLRQKRTLRTRTGTEAVKVMEDIWLGSVIYRELPPVPINYYQIQANGHIVSDGWGLPVSRTSHVVHLRNKLPERFLALHAYMRGDRHCSPRWTLAACRTGCTAFVAKNRVQRWMLLPGNSSRVCQGTQAQTRWCTVETLPNKRCCTGNDCYVKTDIALEAYTPENLARKDRILDRTQRLLNRTRGRIPHRRWTDHPL